MNGKILFRNKTWTYLLVAVLLVTATVSCRNKDSVLITGRIPPSDYKKVYVDLLNVNISQPLDSARLRNGRFRVRASLEEPSFLLLRLEKNNFITLLASPGEQIRVQADTTFLPAGYRVEGSEESRLVQMLDDHLRYTIHKTDSIAALYRSAMDKPGFDTLKSRLEAEYDRIIAGQHKFSVSFILEHMHDLASIKAIYQKLDQENFVLGSVRDIQYMKILNDTLSAYYPDYRIVQALSSDVQRELARYKQLQLSSMAKNADEIGSFDLALPDSEGDTIRLSSLRGKYVLLSFWASWCNSCIEENSYFKSLYKKYHPKGFEIYQVSLDNNKDAWVKAIRFDEIPWICVSDLSYPKSPAAATYNVSQPPRNFLLDPEGSIIATDLHGRSLQIKLSQIFEP